MGNNFCFRAKSLRTPSNMFVVNLAFCDFIMMLKSPIFLYNTFHKGYAAGHIGCQIFAFVGSLSGIGAGMTNAFIAYDRYSTITSPFEKRLTKTKAFVMILFIWCYTIPWAVLPLLEIWSRFVPGILRQNRKHCAPIFSFRGFSNVMHFRLFDGYIRQSRFCSNDFYVFLRHTTNFNYIFLHTNR